MALHKYKNSGTISSSIRERFNNASGRLCKRIGDMGYFDTVVSELRTLNEALALQIPNNLTDKELAVAICKEILFYNELIKISYKIPVNDKLDFHRSIKTDGE